VSTSDTPPTASATRRSFLRLLAVVARRDYLRTVRRRGFLFGTALLPAAMAGFLVLTTLFAPSFEPGPPPALLLVNESALELVVPAGADVRLAERDAALAELSAEGTREVYLLPAGYPDDARVERITPAGRQPSIDDLTRWGSQEQVLASVLRASLLAATDVPPELLARLIEPYELANSTPTGEPAPSPDEAGFGFLLPYAFTFLFVISIFITSGYLLQSVTEEKENRVVEILLSSVPPQPLMAGKIIGLGAAGLTQVAIWVTTALLALPLVVERLPMLSSISISPTVLLLALAFFVVGYLAYGAIFAAVGAIAPGTREAQQYSGFLGFFAVIPLVFASAFLTDPGSWLVILLSLIPLTAPAAMLQVLAIASEVPWPLVLGSLALLTAFAVVAAIGASRVFRATLLLYGVRPSLRRIIGALTARG
jgi:ABC-2 type transport system permease protein